MLRRNLLRIPPVAALAGLLGPGILRAEPDAWQAGFGDALAKHPWLLGFRSVPAPELEARATVTGSLPDGLRGTLYRNGPARHEIGDFRYHHWFDGDGMIQAWRFDDAGVRHRGRMVETLKYQSEQQAGRALYPGFATVPPDPQPVTSPDMTNTANISVLGHGGRLLALWEAGSPWEIDPETLATRGRHVFSPETAGAPFSAHPRLDPDGNLWNFGYASGAGLLVIWHVAPDGNLARTGTIPCDPMGMPHDFVVTARHLVLPIPPFHYEPREGAETFLDAHRWHDDRPTRVLVVDKSDFSEYRWLELPAQWVFHYGNGWEDGDGVIHFDGARADDPMDMVDGFSRVMRGERPPDPNSRPFRYRIDTRGGVISEEALFDGNLTSEFPTVDPRVAGSRNRRLVMLTRNADRPPEHPSLDTVSLYDERSDSLRHFRYPAGVIPEEHLFVGAPGSAPETTGWIVGTALNYGAGRTELHVFDARAIDDGPLATAALPYAVPLGFHGKFLS